jgi:hypothetical protein
MKRVLGICMFVALSCVFAACGSTTSDNDADIPLVGDFPHGGDVDVAADLTGSDVIPSETSQDNRPADNSNVDIAGETSVDTSVVDTAVVDNPVVITCEADKPGSCKNTFACMNACPTTGGQTDPACRADCESQMNSTGSSQYAAINTCIKQNCASATTQDELNTCIDEKCGDVVTACFSGCDYEKCGDLLKCLNACPDDVASTPNIDEFQECGSDCFGNATPEAQNARAAFITCVRTNCVDCTVANPTAEQSASCDTCYGTVQAGVCKTQVEACQSWGTQTCSQVLTCVNNAADDTAVQVCFGGATKTAATLWDEMSSCGRDACTASCPTNPTPEQTTACNTCFTDTINTGSCKPKLDACIADVAVQ